jgi:hypothetical protein
MGPHLNFEEKNPNLKKVQKWVTFGEKHITKLHTT